MIGVVHLVWAPLGPEPLRDFLRSYRAHPPEAEHELIIVLNGAHPGGRDPSSQETLLEELHGTQYRLIVLERPLLDLAAYGAAAREIQHPRVCFLNSYSVLQSDGWLRCLSQALDEPGVGLAAASASWESQAEWMRGRLIYWPYQLVGLRAARRDYPRFPNPHVRTTAFMISRTLLLQTGPDDVRDKRSAYLLESGRSSITRQVQEQGLRPVVAGRDGLLYDVADWPRSGTYRSGVQCNLLVADNRTREWEEASARLRRRLARDAWGERAIL
jgi:hypothetical protein